jgi:hypothetical protein
MTKLMPEKDSDGDGLLDSWETGGLSFTGEELKSYNDWTNLDSLMARLANQV